MSASKGSSQGNSQQAAPSTTIGVGGATSGEAGSTPTHETMAETGGSGGSQQTQPKDLEIAPAAPSSAQQADAASRQAAPDALSDIEPEGAGTPVTATGRGTQDTRSSQAGRLPTGLGTPETGGNQDERDLAPPRK